MNQRKTLRIGVIADTHGHVDPAVRRHFTGVDHTLRGAMDAKERRRDCDP